MAHYAKVENGIVVNVVVADQEWIDEQEGQWVQTSYNTKGNEHREGGTPLRANFAGVGFTYDEEADVFYSPQPYPSWVLDTSVYQWRCPISMPNNGDADTDKARYIWNEEKQQWDEV